MRYFSLWLLRADWWNSYLFLPAPRRFHSCLSTYVRMYVFMSYLKKRRLNAIILLFFSFPRPVKMSPPLPHPTITCSLLTVCEVKNFSVAPPVLSQ